MSSVQAEQPLRPPRRLPSLGHVCPQCRRSWALTAVIQEGGFLVVCRHCSYQRPVTVARR